MEFLHIQNLIKCSKEKCKEKFNKVKNNKMLLEQKNKLNLEKNFDKRDTIIRKIYSNKIQRDLDLCVLKNCEVVKKIKKLRLKSLKDKIKLYDIKLPSDLQIKFEKYEEYSSKKSLTDEEYLDYVILFQIIQHYIKNIIADIQTPFFNSLTEYLKCGKQKCSDLYTEVANDKDLTKKKLSLFNIKHDENRNKVIRDIYSNEKQVKLDKCITKKCNKASLKLIQETIKHLNRKIKTFDIKIPANIKLPDIKKITEADIPEVIIKLNQIARYIDKDKYIAGL
jgi:hypothetical protein